MWWLRQQHTAAGQMVLGKGSLQLTACLLCAAHLDVFSIARLLLGPANQSWASKHAEAVLVCKQHWLQAHKSQCR